MTRREQIQQLRSEGKTMEAIAKILGGISRQRIHQLMQTPERKCKICSKIIEGTNSKYCEECSKMKCRACGAIAFQREMQLCKKCYQRWYSKGKSEVNLDDLKIRAKRGRPKKKCQ